MTADLGGPGVTGTGPTDDPADAAPAGPTVAEVAEEELLAQVFPVLPRGRTTLVGPGDDAAVLSAGAALVVSTDVLVQDRHFRLGWSSGRDVGRRAAAQNLADVAAMGAVPTALVVALVLPPDLPVAWVVDLARGLADACGDGVGVVGGDLSSGAAVTVAVTVLGDTQGRGPVLRDGARAGDVVALAGTLGRSAAGLAALTAGRGERHTDVVATYRSPRPPLAAGPEAADAGVTAMLDVSDGLLRDAGRLARASGAVIDLRTASLAADASALAGVATDLGADPWAWVLGGGEDHGLLATFPPGQVPPSFRPIGHVRPPGEHPAGTVLVDGAAPAVAVGWDHFGGQPRR